MKHPRCVENVPETILISNFRENFSENLIKIGTFGKNMDILAKRLLLELYK